MSQRRNYNRPPVVWPAVVGVLVVTALILVLGLVLD